LGKLDANAAHDAILAKYPNANVQVGSGCLLTRTANSPTWEATYGVKGLSKSTDIKIIDGKLTIDGIPVENAKGGKETGDGNGISFSSAQGAEIPKSSAIIQNGNGLTINNNGDFFASSAQSVKVTIPPPTSSTSATPALPTTITIATARESTSPMGS